MNHPDKYKAKRYDTSGRCAAFTDIVYGEVFDDPNLLTDGMWAAKRSFYPAPPTLKPFVGEMHGHTNLSDGRIDVGLMRPIIYDPCRREYRAVGEKVGKAYSEGRNIG